MNKSAATEADDVAAIDLDVLLPDGAPHLTANVRVGDLLGNGVPQVFVAEPLRGQVVWLRGPDDVDFLRNGLDQPVRTHVADMDGDANQDLLVADIGSILPTVERVGWVVLLRNDGVGDFEPFVLLENVGRVACSEASDLDADGDMDVAVCVFGHLEGEIAWLE